jgi:hypothetical protein
MAHILSKMIGKTMTYKDIKSFKDFLRWIFFVEKPPEYLKSKKKKKGAKKS